MQTDWIIDKVKLLLKYVDIYAVTDAANNGININLYVVIENFTLFLNALILKEMLITSLMYKISIYPTAPVRGIIIDIRNMQSKASIIFILTTLFWQSIPFNIESVNVSAYIIITRGAIKVI